MARWPFPVLAGVLVAAAAPAADEVRHLDVTSHPILPGAPGDLLKGGAVKRGPAGLRSPVEVEQTATVREDGSLVLACDTREAHDPGARAQPRGGQER